MFRVADLNTGERKFVGRSKAKVLDNNDPEARGRIIVDHPLLGSTVWIDYLNSPGMFSVPDIDDVVYIECDCGYGTHPIAWGNVTTGDDTPNLPEVFQRENPTNRGFYTAGGHLIEIDDGEDPDGSKQGFRITTSGGNIISILEDSTASDGLITLKTKGGLKSTFDGNKDIFTLTTNGGLKIVANGADDSFTAVCTDKDSLELSKANGFQITTPASGGTSTSQKSGKYDIVGNVQVTLTDGNGNTVVMDSSGINITDSSTNNITMSSSGIMATTGAGAELNLSAAKVALGNGTAELLDLFDQLLTKVTTICTDLSTTTAAGFGAPISSVAAFATLATTDLPLIQSKLAGIKGSL